MSNSADAARSLTYDNRLNIEVRRANIDERPVLRHLMELYQYDFSEFDHADIGPMGIYDYPYLDHYWVEQDRFPYLVRVNNQLAGFVLVSRFNYLTGHMDTWVMSEFFIMRKYRYRGIGVQVACEIFNRHPGAWQVAEIDENRPAIAFWRKVINHHTQGDFEEHLLDNEHWRGPVQTFIALSTASNPDRIDRDQ